MFLFEVAWEVCNQVGGIYQVVRSKVPLMTARWLDQYCMVGPYVENKAQLELEPLAATGWLARAIERLEKGGLAVHHGRWLIQGKPRVLLLEHTRLAISCRSCGGAPGTITASRPRPATAWPTTR